VKTYALLTQFVPIAGHLPSMFLATVVNSCPGNTSLTLPTPRPAQLISGVQGASLQRDPTSLSRRYRCEFDFSAVGIAVATTGWALGVRSF
jgi:hypothetical protein